jgi:hypothetical protein
MKIVIAEKGFMPLAKSYRLINDYPGLSIELGEKNHNK